MEGVGRFEKGSVEGVGEVMEKLWFTLEIGVCELAVNGVETLIVLLLGVCSVEKVGDILGLGLIGVVLLLACDAVSWLFPDTCEHLVSGITGCSGPSINCLKRLSGSLTVLELFWGVSTTVL